MIVGLELPCITLAVLVKDAKLSFPSAALKPLCVDGASSSLPGAFLEVSNMLLGYPLVLTHLLIRALFLSQYSAQQSLFGDIHLGGGNNRRRLNGILRSQQPYACQADTVLEGQGAF